MATTKGAAQLSIEARLRRAGAEIDRIVAKARGAGEAATGRVGARVDALRAHEARARTRLRELRDRTPAGWDAPAAELDRELDELDVAIAIAAARLDAAVAVGDQAFITAVEAEMDAWGIHLDVLQARAAAARPQIRARRETAVRRIREQRAAVKRTLHLLRNGSPEASDTGRAHVSQAIDDLDRAADKAADEFD